MLKEVELPKGSYGDTIIYINEDGEIFDKWFSELEVEEGLGKIETNIVDMYKGGFETHRFKIKDAMYKAFIIDRDFNGVEPKFYKLDGEESKPFIIHLDGDINNNKLENLIALNPQQYSFILHDLRKGVDYTCKTYNEIVSICDKKILEKEKEEKEKEEKREAKLKKKKS